MNKKRKNKLPSKKRSRKNIIKEYSGVISLNREGYGFVAIEELEEDIFIPQKYTGRALTGDLVLVRVKSDNSNIKKPEGRIIDVLERSSKTHIGILQIANNQAWVIIENKNMPYDIKVSTDNISPLDNGKKVAAIVKDWPRTSTLPIGEITDILGEPGENNTEMHAILAEFGLPYKFKESVEEAAAKIPVEISPKEIKARRDLRDTLTFTIDPADAKDFDDAISFKELPDGNYQIGVHIADVTHYVKPDDIIDKEAIERGTSVYLVDRTVPMLPEVLSNNLCSLRPNEEKLTFSAIFDITPTGKIVDRWFGRTIINSCRRYSYEQAQEIIESNGATTIKYIGQMSNSSKTKVIKLSTRKRKGERFTDIEVAKSILTLHKIATQYRNDRFKNGAIGFERPEMKVLVTEDGKPINVVQKVTKEANWLIEEYMLLANKEVATFITKGMRLKAPTFVYRVHDEPDLTKINALGDFIKPFGYSIKKGSSGKEVSKQLNNLLQRIKDKPEKSAIEMVALRSMARAKYSTDNIGHYGLAFDYYTHFTSPIRRYPDMMVHRLLAHYLNKGKNENKQYYEELCKHSSYREHLATEAERSSIKYKLAEFMAPKIGEEFNGIISGVTEWGMFVEIDETHIEGAIMLRNIKEDFFLFDEKTLTLRGKSSRKRFRLGDKVRVKVSKVNMEQKTIDYTLIWKPKTK